jgi:hypothetical protein
MAQLCLDFALLAIYEVLEFTLAFAARARRRATGDHVNPNKFA